MLHIASNEAFANASHPLTGDYLAYNHLPAYGRAFLAADLNLDHAHLVKPTITQAAAVCRVSPAYAAAARKVAYSLPHLRTDAEAGRRPLLEAAYGRSATNAMLKLWNACSVDERIRFTRQVGVEAVFGIIELAIGVDDGGVS
jgi:hypothetical protein